MKIMNAPFIQEMIDTTTNMYRLGWDERNGGNISYLLDEEEVSQYLDLEKVIRVLPIDFDGSALIGKIFVITGSGIYFKNVGKRPEESLGIFRISKNGSSIEVLWGFENDGIPTSELPSHLMSHIARLTVDPKNRVVLHTHATHLLAMSFTHPLIEKDFTRTLWKMCTECLVVFPEGVGIIPWMVPGTTEIGSATAEKIKTVRLVVWPHHGIYASGHNLDEAFGLVETAEKAAKVFTYVRAQGEILQEITDSQLVSLGRAFGVTPRAGYLD